MAPVIAGILSIAKALPAIAAIIKILADARAKRIERKVLSRYRAKQEVKERLFEKLKVTTCPEERIKIIEDIKLLDPFID